MTVPAQKPHRSKQNYATPEVFMDAVKRRLGIKQFECDFAADNENTKAERFWSEKTNALSKSVDEWANVIPNGWGWLNPPFTKIAPWAHRCEEVQRLRGGDIALLVPAAVGSNWFRDHVNGKAMVLLLNGRIPFMPERPNWLYPKDCILCLYGCRPGYEVWNWRNS